MSTSTPGIANFPGHAHDAHRTPFSGWCAGSAGSAPTFRANPVAEHHRQPPVLTSARREKAGRRGPHAEHAEKISVTVTDESFAVRRRP